MLRLLLGSCLLSCTQSVEKDAAAGEAPDRVEFKQPILGLNEAVSVPRALILNNMLSNQEIQNRLTKEAELTADLGAQTVRANSHTYPFLNFYDSQKIEWQTHADRYVQTVQAYDLEAVLVIGPWPGIQTALYTSAYLPNHMEEYLSWVEAVVERYDGDGYKDMPNLKRPIQYWEVDNEPDLHNHRPPRGRPQGMDPSQFETPDEYALMLNETSLAIRKANPNAKILFGGLASVQNQHGQDYLTAVLSKVEPNAFDILSVHCYIDKPNINSLIRSMSFIRRLLPKKPIWLTETGVPSDQRQTWMTENKQGEMLFEIVISAIENGFERVYWHTLRTPEKKKGPFASHGLLQSRRDNYAEKPSAMVYKALAEILASSQWLQRSSAGLSTNLGSFLSTDNDQAQHLFPPQLKLPSWLPSPQPDK